MRSGDWQMSDKKTDETLNHWTDYFIDGIPWLFTVIGIIWLLIGVAPFFLSGMNIAASGQLGDSFGMANSLFSGFAFTVAMWKLQLNF